MIAAGYPEEAPSEANGPPKGPSQSELRPLPLATLGVGVTSGLERNMGSKPYCLDPAPPELVGPLPDGSVTAPVCENRE